MNDTVKIAIVGGGPAGLAAALGAYEAGISPEDILIIERDLSLGGILNQCIHAGFGLHRFGEELTGPEYAERYIKKVVEAKIPFITDAMVLSLDAEKNIKYISPKTGLVHLKAEAVILAMGIAFSFAACGNDQNGTNNNGTENNSNSAERSMDNRNNGSMTDGIMDAGDSMMNGARDMGNAVENGVNDMGNAVQNGINSTTGTGASR